MISVGEALRLVVDTAAPLGAERVSLVEACGRVAAEDVISTRAVPAADNSAMDGFAVRAEDVTQPGARLRLVGSIPAGSVRGEPLARGAAVKIFTGSVVPPGADTVVRVEDTEALADHVVVTIAHPRGANVRLAGEDIAAGATVVRAGQEVGPAEVGVLASIGRAAVTVHRRPRVAILSTGAELVEVDERPGPGQVVNSNAYALAAAVREAGLAPLVLPIVRDRFEDIRARLEEATDADVILSTGGVSVGEFDFVKEALDAIGVERLFWKVAQKPGKPLTVGHRRGRLFFGLPGNPVSALVCFAVYAWPALRRMAGHVRLHLPSERAVLGTPVRRKPGLTEFVRVQLERSHGRLPVATPFRSQSSGVLTGLAGGAGLLVAPADRGALEPGEELDVLRPGPYAAAGAHSVLLAATVASPGETC